MMSKFIYGFILLGILSISNISYAQELNLQEIITGKKDTREEDKNLEFQSHFFEALKQYAINNYSKAIESLETCYELDSANLAVEFEFSKNYLKLKKYFEAEIFIDKALLQEPENEYLIAHKASVFKTQRNFVKAIEVQKKLIEINPKYSDELVFLYLQNRDFESAKNLISDIEENALSTTKIKGYKRYLENREKIAKKPKNTVNNSTEASNLNDLRALYNTKNAYKILVQLLNKEVENDLFDLLFSDSSNGLELFPSQPFLYKMNGLALNKLAKYNEAIVVLTIGIDFVVEDAEMEASFYEQLSIAHAGLNNKNEALKFKLKAEKLRKGD